MTEYTAKKVILKDATGNYLIPYTEQELPSQIDNSGKYLTTNGTTPSWVAPEVTQNQLSQKADSSYLRTVIETIFHVGAICITVNTSTTCPVAALIPGSVWQLVSANCVLRGTSSVYNAGGSVAAGLPNISGKLGVVTRSMTNNGAVAVSSKADWKAEGADWVFAGQATINASRSSSIYGSSSTVQPPAYLVNIWQRTA